MGKLHSQLIDPMRHWVLSSARESRNGRIFWRGGEGGGACGRRSGSPSRVRITKQVVKIVTNTKLVVCLKRVCHPRLEFLRERRVLKDCHPPFRSMLNRFEIADTNYSFCWKLHGSTRFVGGRPSVS